MIGGKPTRKPPTDPFGEAWYWGFTIPWLARKAANMDLGLEPITRENVRLVCEAMPWWQVPDWYWRQQADRARPWWSPRRWLWRLR